MDHTDRDREKQRNIGTHRQRDKENYGTHRQRQRDR